MNVLSSLLFHTINYPSSYIKFKYYLIIVFVDILLVKNGKSNIWSDEWYKKVIIDINLNINSEQQSPK